MRHQNRHQNRRKNRRGMGMAAVMLVLMGILAMTLIGLSATTSGGKGYGGMLGTVTNAVQASNARSQSAAAFNLAESGVQYTISWMAAQPAPPSNTSAFAPVLWGAGMVGTPPRAQISPDPANPGNHFSVRIYPDSYNSDVSSTTSTQKKYLIESVGVSGGVTTVVQAYVGQGSLSKYLVLLDSWNNSGNFWVSGLTTFDGPVHDNNANGVSENVFWTDNGGKSPMFTYTGDDAYSVSSPNGITWWENWNPNTTPQVLPNGNNQWLNVAAGGAGTVQQGTPAVRFPTSSSLQLAAATRGAPTNPTGVTLCPGGGIYIEGDVSDMTLSTSGANNTSQVITVTQGTTVQRVTINPATGLTTLEQKLGNGNWATVSVLTGTTNGVLYCNGNIGAQGDPKTGGLHGQIADNQLDSNGNQLHHNGLTIATPQSDNCNLDGSILYNTQRQVAKDSSGNPIYIDVNGNHTSDPTKGTPVFVSEDADSNFTSKAGTLGLISNDVLVTESDSAGNPLNNFQMDGTVLASDRYDADHYDGRPVGLWENMGGYLSKNVGTFGVFGGNLQLTNGFNTQFNYDARMRNTPPPFFPTTGNHYDVISWQQVAQTLE